MDEQDVVGLRGRRVSAVCAAILRFREGRLVDKSEFLFHDTQDIAALREEFLPRYYLEDNEFIPKSIAVDELPAGARRACSACWARRGAARCELYVPQRGDTRPSGGDGAHQRLRAPGARERTLCPRAETCWTNWPRLLGPESSRPGSSRATTSPTGATAPAWRAWWCLRTANPKKRATAASRCTRVAGTDDYASMAETLARRAAEYEKGAKGQFGIKPDLLLIDGGRGQVGRRAAPRWRAHSLRTCPCSAW